jgi:hypothetical protein
MQFRFISFAGWLLLGLVLSSTAQAGLVRETVNGVRSVAEPVTAPVTAPTSPTKPPVVPKAPSPSSPSPPTEKVTKPVTEVVGTATNTVQAAAPGSSAGSGSGSSGSQGTRSAGSTDGGGGGVAGNAAQGASGRLAGQGGGPSSMPGAPGAGRGNPGLERRHTSSPAGSGSIFSARPAPDPLFSAYVWPAIALGGASGVLLAAMDLPIVGDAALPLSSALPGILAGAAVAAGESFGDSPVGRGLPPPMPSAPGPSPYTPGQLPDSNEIWFIVLLLLCLAPLTLFAYTIRREVKALSRWPHA